MSAGDERGGRQDNGLVAADYAAVGLVRSQQAERVLAALAAQGIAAYLDPTPPAQLVADITTQLVTACPLSGDITHLFVDRERLDAARATMEEVEGQPSPGDEQIPSVDIDSAFATIVANLTADSSRPIPSWPQSQPWPRVETDSVKTGGNEDEEDEEHYVPRLPPDSQALAPCGRGDPPDRRGDDAFPVANSAAGAVDATLALGFLGALSGVLLLVWRLRPNRDDDDPDNGARV